MAKKGKNPYSETCLTKKEAKERLEYYRHCFGDLVFYQSLDKRVTLAVYPAIKGNAPQFFRVSGAHCSPNDKPRKYAGMLQALMAERFTVSANNVDAVAEAFMGCSNFTIFR